jgi:hypothetical protein
MAKTIKPNPQKLTPLGQKIVAMGGTAVKLICKDGEWIVRDESALLDPWIKLLLQKRNQWRN